MTAFYSLEGKRVKEHEMGPGSVSLIHAINKSASWELVELIKLGDDKAIEYVIADITCDEVPSRNKVGIQYSERIGFKVTDQIVPTTYALRQKFPILIHQNATPPDSPRDLCLYLEPTDVVESTWTAEKHLKRVSWWLMQASRGELHPQDQALEPLFFPTLSSIVLPPDFQLECNAGRKIFITAFEPNRDTEVPCGTYVAHWQSCRGTKVKLNTIDIRLPPATHGIVNYMPYTFRELALFCEKRTDANLTSLVREKLSELKGDSHQMHCPTCIILRFPIRRDDSAKPEKNQLMAVLTRSGISDLLKLFEVSLNGLPNVSALAGNLRPMTTCDIELPLEPVECLIRPDERTRRAQSGIQEAGGNGLIIGAGALGGALVDFWARCGWGKWVVVDDDYFRPHNFTRHVALDVHVGQSKSQAMAQIGNIHAGHLSMFSHLHLNATEFADQDLKGAYRTADLVVDATASIAYPRKVSGQRHAPRHLSVFFTPDGRDAVMLTEDKQRHIRLNALEAQYYRSVINEDWGRGHLDTPKSFRSGTGCRDISVTMSHFRVMSHASLLAEHIMMQAKGNEASISVWVNELTSGNRVRQSVPVYKTKSYESVLSDFRVVWDEGTEKKLHALRTKHLPMETGGIIVGYHDLPTRHVFIVDVLPAPSDSQHHNTWFKRGTEGVAEIVEEIQRRTAGNVSYLGEWHSHPRGSSSELSGLDSIQLDQIASRLAEDGLPAYSMIVSDRNIKVFERRL
ncbi:ThiF family adenylyltransferase [Photobacterium alginatilyticum]|uniref:Thiamine biosynthesis protein ThiF n=1 Tax=Photobacterium alginatilyticum TaxID=1775171 RepID=A0ABW9YL82_9GAMM|nr:ThiF family adenylyltransferase [Photobacterium alginatilyticum]NBI54553.1 hypothetical protein [Photobacterium alginatilyticum]